MLKPINNHLLIEPLKHESFISSDKGSYEEVGVVIDGDSYLMNDMEYIVGIGDVGKAFGKKPMVKKGDKIYFDSWLASKFPKNDNEFFWLVKWEDVKAIDDGN